MAHASSTLFPSPLRELNSLSFDQNVAVCNTQPMAVRQLDRPRHGQGVGSTEQQNQAQGLHYQHGKNQKSYCCGLSFMADTRASSHLKARCGTESLRSISWSRTSRCRASRRCSRPRIARRTARCASSSRANLVRIFVFQCHRAKLIPLQRSMLRRLFPRLSSRTASTSRRLTS